MKTGPAPMGYLARCSVVCVSVGIALLVASATYGQKPPKIGGVNFQEVALQSKAGKAAKARLEELADRVKEEVEAAASRLTPAERKNRADALEREELALKRLVQDKTEELKKAEMDSIL